MQFNHKKKYLKLFLNYKKKEKIYEYFFLWWLVFVVLHAILFPLTFRKLTRKKKKLEPFQIKKKYGRAEEKIHIGKMLERIICWRLDGQRDHAINFSIQTDINCPRRDENPDERLFCLIVPSINRNCNFWSVVKNHNESIFIRIYIYRIFSYLQNYFYETVIIFRRSFWQLI